jgi:hypothetical protein
MTAPVLMVNSRVDFLFPLESAQPPPLQAFGTPSKSKDKKHVRLDRCHATTVAQQPDLGKTWIDWLDQYPGPVQLRP